MSPKAIDWVVKQHGILSSDARERLLSKLAFSPDEALEELKRSYPAWRARATAALKEPPLFADADVNPDVDCPKILEGLLECFADELRRIRRWQ